MPEWKERKKRLDLSTYVHLGKYGSISLDIAFGKEKPFIDSQRAGKQKVDGAYKKETAVFN